MAKSFAGVPWHADFLSRNIDKDLYVEYKEQKRDRRKCKYYIFDSALKRHYCRGLNRCGYCIGASSCNKYVELSPFELQCKKEQRLKLKECTMEDNEELKASMEYLLNKKAKNRDKYSVIKKPLKQKHKKRKKKSVFIKFF